MENVNNPHIVRLDTLHAKEVAQRIYENNGYCCCAIVKDDDTICMCKDFRDKVKEPEFYGECHCGLFAKVK